MYFNPEAVYLSNHEEVIMHIIYDRACGDTGNGYDCERVASTYITF